MKMNRRWMISVKNGAATLDVQMPWAPGSMRAEWRARCSARATNALIANA